jgi:hypothetical protein
LADSRLSFNEERRLSFQTDVSEPFIDYALRLVEGFCLVRVDRAASDQSRERSDLYYGNDRERDCSIRLPFVPRYSSDTIPGLPLNGSEPFDGANVFPFDLFSALRFWLVDEGNAELPDDAFDRHDRLLGLRSVQESLAVREEPIVNAYLIAFRDWLGRRLGVPPRSWLPEGKRCVIALSHDVDRPLDPGDLRPTLALAGKSIANRERPLLAPIYVGIALGQAARAARRARGTRRWLFSELIKAEADRGLRSTFFFAPTSRFHRRGRYWDVAYDVSTPRFEQLCRTLTAEGNEVGLHSGYEAHNRPEQLSEEKELLEEVAGKAIQGHRHHFWRMSRPFWSTLEAHAAAKLTYDASIAFNEVPGFRLGVALPLHLWNPERHQRLPVTELPTVAMDGSFFYSHGQTVDATVAHVKRLVDSLKEYEGAATLDWHQETSYPSAGPFRLWGEAYLAILDLLAADPEVSVQPCQDLVDWAMG